MLARTPSPNGGSARAAALRALLLAAATIAGLTALFARVLHVGNPTTVALSLLLVVLVVATVSRRWVAVVTSLLAFLSFNFFFLPPVGTWAIADPGNWVALFTLLAVSVVASHLSAEVRRRAEETVALLERQKEAEIVRRGAEIKSTLLESLSHDLQTPLTAVTVAVNNLDDPRLSGDRHREQLDVVRTELARLNRLFQQIVEMARIEAKAVAPEREWVQPGDIVEAAMRQVGPQLDTRRVEVDPGDESTLVRLDPRLASTALAHLLENAAQYSPAAAPITVRATLADRELRIAVRDHGTGIPPAELDQLFERYYRGAGGGHRFGTGMGLAIARGLLAAEGGRVWVENHRGGGAVFTIAVPVETRAAAAIDGEAL